MASKVQKARWLAEQRAKNAARLTGDVPAKTGSGVRGGRPRGIRVAPATRERIRGGMLIDRLEKIALGQADAQPHEVTAGLGLLRFQLPVLQATDLTSNGQSLNIIRQVFASVVADESSPKLLPSVTGSVTDPESKT
jgi:hypothetical protein